MGRRVEEVYNKDRQNSEACVAHERIVTGSGRTQIKSPYKVIAPQSDMPSVPRVELAREKEVRRVGKKERNDVQNARGQPTFPPIF